MKRMFKKLMALTLALAMVGSTMAMAAQTTSGDTTGEGSMEGFVAPEADVFSVELPTSAGFEFVLDPQGLIAKTEGAAYDELEVESTTGVYFANYNAAGQIAGYSEFSDVMAIINRGNVEVEVGLTATITASTGLTVVSTAEAAGADNNTNVYLGVEIGTVDASGVFTETSEVAGATAAADVFDAEAVAALTHTAEPVYKYNESEDEYYTEYPAEDVVTYSGLYFRVTGAVNQAEGAAEAWNTLVNGEGADPVEASLALAWSISADTTASHTAYVKPYTVTFNMGTWGANFTQQVAGDNASKATAPTAPVVDGFEFVGWYEDAEFATEFDFAGTTITDNNTVVYAKYAPSVGVRSFGVTLAATANQTTTVVLPAGATGITSITNNATSTAVSASRYTLDAEAGTLQFLGIFLKTLTEGTHTFTVVFNDTSATAKEFTITVTAPVDEPEEP